MEFHDRRQPKGDDERNFEVHDQMLHVGGRPFPLAQVRRGDNHESGYLQHITIPTESGWELHGHLLYGREGEPRGRSGHVIGPMTIIHGPTFKEHGPIDPAFHEFPQGTPDTDTNTFGRRILKTVRSPEQFHDLVRYTSRLVGGGSR